MITLERAAQFSKAGKLGGARKHELHPEHIERMREISYRVVTCPNCGREGTYRIMKRWHFDNCRW